jgi:glycosyltransferase involved in cell wall biosynthesis
VTQSNGSKTVSCILLTLNEEGAISKVVADIRRVLPEAQIVVVDSSTDKTAELAEGLGCTIVRQLPPKGYGWALDAGFKKATGDYIITLDCDDTYPTDVLKEVVTRMDAGADLVSCSRMQKRPQAMKFSHYLANRIFALAACVLCGAKTTDVHTGMRAYRKQMLEKLPIDPEGMALPVELQICPQRLGYKCQEFFIEYRPRVGESKIVPLEGTIWTFRRIWRWRKFFNSNRVQSTLLTLLALLAFSSMLPATPKPNQKLPKQNSAPARMVTCRRFIQKNPILGELEVKLIPNAYRVELKNSGCVQLAVGPQWNSVLLNEDAKIVCTKQKDNWWARAIGIGTQVTNTTGRKISPKKERVLWMETTKVSIAADPLALPVDCYYYQDPTIPVSFCKRMATQSGVPHMGGLIVRVKTSKQEGPAAVKLDTLKADKITVPARQFEIPPGFKEVFSPQEVMLGAGADGLKDFLP